MTEGENTGAGRPGKYETHVAPRLDDIKEWARVGATHKEIAAALNVGYSTFCKYLGEHEDLALLVEEAQMSGVPEVKLALYKRAVGYEYEEKKMSERRDADGVTRKYMEVTTKQVAPDVNAIGMFLRNFGEGWKDKDEFAYKFKEMELDLKKKSLELGEWK